MSGAAPRAATLPRWVGVAGPTACGKSAVVLELAGRLGRGGQPVEIVSVDSAQVYRGMDVGTAKPGAAERAAVPHHLIDLIEPTESYSAARFVADARVAMAAIRGRGAVPLLVGGTMLYFKALIDGLDALPAADPALRAELEAQAARAGWPALHAELARVDPDSAARLAPNDAQRIQRALEVWRASGVPLSRWHTRSGGAGAHASRTCGPAEAALFALEPVSREWLHARIAQRFAAMLTAGLVDEVRALRERGDLHAGLPSMRCVGYRQAWALLDGEFPAAELAERGIAATRQLAKRQMTWLRSLRGWQALPCAAADTAERLAAAVRRLEATAPP